MIYILDQWGNLKKASRRESKAGHWEIFRRARREAPALCDAMYRTIAEAIESQEFFDSEKRQMPNSTWVGKRILTSWKHKEEWDRFCGDEDASSALFGEIMWTYMWDDEREWYTTKTSKTNEGREERVYFLRG